MDMYQHDSAARFQFILRGELSGNQVPYLEHAWTTARSIVKAKEVVLDVSGVTLADPPGMELLHRMQDSGVQLTAALPAESEKLLKSFSIPVETPRGEPGGNWARRLLRRVLESAPRGQ